MKNKKIILISIITLVVLVLLFINYRVVNNIDFTLIGHDKIAMNKSDSWTDPGYNVSDSYKDKVKVINELDLTKEGTYKVKYILRILLFSKTLEREITVLNEDKESDIVLSLYGNNPYYLMNGKEYIEPGIKAYDRHDGNIDSSIITNNINNLVNGNYEIDYQITNTSGISKTIKRMVIVYSFDFQASTKYIDYSQNNEININISDNQYSYTLLPNNDKTTERTINYQVNENGLYTFAFFDKNNNEFKYDININNIDNEVPSGSCTLSLTNNGGTITVNATDNTEINGYEYSYGNNKTNIVPNNNYSITTLDEIANVTIYDKANNKTTISCNTIDNSTKVNRSYTLKNHTYHGKTYQYWLYTPKNSQREKVPLLIYFHGDGGRPNVNSVNKYALPKYIKEGEDYPFYMVAPHCNSYSDFSQENYMNFVLDLIDYITNNYNIDTDRIIMAGGSSGARGAYTITSLYKDKFSCLVIISGITYQLYTDKEKNLTYLPIWVFHGRNDKNVNYNDVKIHVDNINKYGGNAKLTTYEGGHDSTDIAFKTKEVIDWIVAQKKK